jgi:hypothetical protein
LISGKSSPGGGTINTVGSGGGYSQTKRGLNNVGGVPSNGANTLISTGMPEKQQMQATKNGFQVSQLFFKSND